MNNPEISNSLSKDDFVETACGARIRITTDAPHTVYRGQVIYFCGWDCKQLYDEDPLSSCLAGRILSSR